MLSQVVSGMEGVERNMALPPPTVTPYDAGAELLPTNLGAAIGALEASELYRKRLGNDFVDYYAHLKRSEWNRYLPTLLEWEHAEYFETF